MKMKSRYPGKCHGCNKGFKVGSWILWDPETKDVRHIKCKNRNKHKNPANAGVCLPGQRARFVTGK